MLLSQPYLKSKEYNKALLKNIISSTLIEIGGDRIMGVKEEINNFKVGEPMTHDKWIKEEGGIENATHDETIAQECQKKRIQWLCHNSVGDTILELGCNWGYILNAVCKYNQSTYGLGIDINPKNISRALTEFPNCFFIAGDITDTENFIDVSYDTVLLPDVLEHIPAKKVFGIIKEALRIASNRLLITLPLEEIKAHCFKHKWIVNDVMIMSIVKEMRVECKEVNVTMDKDFYFIKGIKV